MPGGRSSYATAVDTSSGALFLFGGHRYTAIGSGIGTFFVRVSWLYIDIGAGTGYLGDMWRWDPQTQYWGWVGGNKTIGSAGVYQKLNISSATAKPGARAGHCMFMNGNSLVLFGGYGFDGGAKLCTPCQISRKQLASLLFSSHVE